MKELSYYIDKTQEVGFVEKIIHSLAYLSGLPQAKPYEIVVFEDGGLGQIIALNPEYVEVLLLSNSKLRVGTKAARTDTFLEIGVGDGLLGRVFDPLGKPLGTKGGFIRGLIPRPLITIPLGIKYRKNIDKPFETGITLVDLTIPLGKGQRELVIGDRKSGKTLFLQQVVVSAARQGMVCIYASIAKRWFDTQKTIDFFQKNGVSKNIIVVAAGPADAAGKIFLTPYTAMTYAEYFRDKGMDVLLILDDMTAHAKYYREIMLSAKRFPGRSSYPGDIFFIHSRVLERGGNFTKGSITVLPVAETTFRDISGYIQTNLMSMTDGHIFFDGDLSNQGRRPAINQLLSVTRVGLQAQTPLVRDINRQLSRFIVFYEKMRQYMHFGSELSIETQKTLILGERMVAFFDQSSEVVIPLNINIILLAGLWGGFWKETDPNLMKKEMQALITNYETNTQFKGLINNLVADSKELEELVIKIKENEAALLGKSRIGLEQGGVQ